VREPRDILQDSKQFAVERPFLSWWHLCSTLAVLGFLVTLTIVSEPWALKLAASLALGLVMVRCFILYHDSEHGAIFSKAPLAKALLRCYGILVLNPPSIWSRSHNHHHRNNAKIYGASIGSFPVMTRQRYADAPGLERLNYTISRHPLTICLGYLTIFLWGMCLRSFLKNPRTHWDSALAVGLHVGLVTSLVLTHPESLPFVVLIPMLVSSALGAYLFYAQHNYPGVHLQDRENWTYIHAALHSSSFIRMSPALHWFTGNIGYHHVHHLNARIPFYRLPEAMKGIKELQHPGETSLGIGDVRRCLHLKLWDPEAGRLVPFERRGQR
jgi:omega-6 fatty acid desaturase (delta-12 desaturase)